MAKVKQKKSMQEMLEEAIVLMEQAPFAIPKNWCFVKLSCVCGLQNGEKLKGEFLPYLDAKYLRGKSDGEYKNEGVILDIGQKVILVDGENSGEVFDVFERGYMGSTFRILSVTKNVIPDLIKYFISFYQENLRNNKVGSAIPHLNKSIFYNLLFPLAPLSEQKRIVDKIESLFLRLDEAKDLIQKSLDEFEDRKAAVLHKAFNGELTEKWRKANNLLKPTIKKSFNQFCSVVRGGSPRPAGSEMYYNGKIPFMKVGDITNSKTPYINRCSATIKEAGLSKTRLVSKNTLLLTNSGATLGVPGITSFDTAFNDGIAAFIGIPSESVKYFYYFWITQTKSLRALNIGAAQPNLNTKIVGEVKVVIPTIEEQQEIVRILDEFFEKEDKSKELLDMIDQIEEMKKSILSRAFRGELGTHSDTDEPAIELIKKINREER